MTNMTNRDEQPTRPDNATPWTLAEAKAKLSEVVARALAGKPQTITRHGRSAVVVVSAADWKRRSQRPGNLADFFAASPLRNSGLNLERINDSPRKIDL